VGEKQADGESTGGDPALTETAPDSAAPDSAAPDSAAPDGAAPDSNGTDGVDASTTEQIEECRDEAARDARSGSAVAGIETGLGLAGLLGFTIAVVYCSLWGMRTGLLTRFWGSLGIALGAVFVFFTLFTLVWFIYIGLLFAGWVPGGRPPAWASGTAMPWPKGGPRGRGGDDDSGGGPGGGSDPDGPSGGPVLEGFGEEVPDQPAPQLEPAEAPEPASAPEVERRKRKKRNG
jgi:hypothetical protein